MFYSFTERFSKGAALHPIDLVTVCDAILTGGQTRLDVQRLYGNPMSNYFHKTSLPKTS